MKKLEKRGDYAVGARMFPLAKQNYKNAIKKYFHHFALNSVLKGSAVRGIRREFDEYKDFKNSLVKKINAGLIASSLSTISTEESDKFEDEFVDKLNWKNEKSFKKQKFDYEKYKNYLKEFDSIIDKEFE